MPMKAPGIGSIALGVALMAVPAAADDPCHERICVARYHFRGTQEGGRCQTAPAPVNRALGHYDVDAPLCPDGWHVDGDDCARDVCCYRRACDRDERYRDGYCHRGPAPFTLARSPHPATCAVGERLDLAKGHCRRLDCEQAATRPVSAGARRAAARRQQAPPPPAVAGRGDPTHGTRITGYEPGHCLDKGAPFTIRGIRFGQEQGGRSAQLGGHGIGVNVPVRSWSDTRIEATLPHEPRIQTGEWYYVGIKDARGNWISNLSKNVVVCRGLQ